MRNGVLYIHKAESQIKIYTDKQNQNKSHLNLCPYTRWPKQKPSSCNILYGKAKSTSVLAVNSYPASHHFQNEASHPGYNNWLSKQGLTISRLVIFWNVKTQVHGLFRNLCFAMAQDTGQNNSPPENLTRHEAIKVWDNASGKPSSL